MAAGEILRHYHLIHDCEIERTAADSPRESQDGRESLLLWNRVARPGGTLRPRSLVGPQRRKVGDDLALGVNEPLIHAGEGEGVTLEAFFREFGVDRAKSVDVASAVVGRHGKANLRSVSCGPCGNRFVWEVEHVPRVPIETPRKDSTWALDVSPARCAPRRGGALGTREVHGPRRFRGTTHPLCAERWIAYRGMLAGW